MNDPESTEQAEATESPPIPTDWDGSPRVVVFFIALPLPLSLPDGLGLVLERSDPLPWPADVTGGIPDEVRREGNNWVAIRIWQIPDVATLDNRANVHSGVVADLVVRGQQADWERPVPPIVAFDTFATVVEARTPLLPVLSEGQIDVVRTLSDAFDAAFDEVVMLCRARLVHRGEEWLRPPVRHMLSPAVPWATYSAGDDTEQFGGMGLFLVNAGRHVTPPTIDEEPDVYGLLTMLSRMAKGDPFVPYSEHSRLAWRALLYEGDTVEAVVRGHIASEVLFDALLMLLAWEEGVAADEASRWFDATLSNRVRTRYSSRLGGSWDLARGDQPIGAWSSNVRALRNRVAHGGIIPTTSEATAALSALNALADWLKGRLVAKARTYPRTALLFIGQVGFEKRGVFRGRIRRFVEEDMPSESNWLESFGEWRAAFIAARGH